MNIKDKMISNLLDVYSMCDDKKYFYRKYYEDNGEYSLHYIKKHFNTWASFLRVAGLQHSSFYKKDDISNNIITDILSVYSNAKDKKDFCLKYYLLNGGLFSRKNIKKFFSSWEDILIITKIQPTKRSTNTNITKEDIINDILFVKSNFNEISSKLYKIHGKLPISKAQKFFGSFTKAVHAAGILPKHSGRIYTGEELLELIRDLYNRYGFITFKLIKKNTNISTATIIKYVGKIDKICELIGKNYVPVCSRFECILDIISEYLNEKPIFEFTDNRFIHQKTNANLRIDAYYKNANLAIEYDGSQHYRYSPVWHKSYDHFLYRQYLDKVKEHLLEKAQIPLVRYTYIDSIEKENVLNKIKQIITN